LSLHVAPQPECARLDSVETGGQPGRYDKSRYPFAVRIR
jgi:hypothetical protein